MRSSNCPTGRCSYKDHDDEDGDDADVRQLGVVMINTKLTARPGFLKLETPHVLRCPSRTKKCAPASTNSRRRFGMEERRTDLSIMEAIFVSACCLCSSGSLAMEVWDLSLYGSSSP